jgi:hypothetical protein
LPWGNSANRFALVHVVRQGALKVHAAADCAAGISNRVMLAEITANRVLDQIDPP